MADLTMLRGGTNGCYAEALSLVLLDVYWAPLDVESIDTQIPRGNAYKRSVC